MTEILKGKKEKFKKKRTQLNNIKYMNMSRLVKGKIWSDEK